MKILSIEQIRKWDRYTIQNEPISSIALMERASLAFVNWFKKTFPDRNKQIYVCCGPGNNGGDGFAVARLLSQDHYEVKTFLLNIAKQLSPDCQANKNRLIKERCCELIEINKGEALPQVSENGILIDAIFGSGLSRPIGGEWAEFVSYLNKLKLIRVAIDMPSGMFADQPTDAVSINADFTFSFEIPKLGFLFPENNERVGEWHFGSIGLLSGFLKNEKTDHYFITKNMIQKIIGPRKKYDHKGTFGHALLIAGEYGKIGAAVLAAKAVLRSGAGLLSIYAPGCAYNILQTAVPEAMCISDKNEKHISSIPNNLSKYKAIGIGCGIGTNKMTANVLESLLENINPPLVLDADALNLIATHPKFFNKIPKGSILTPHPKEFERLFGKTKNSFARNNLQKHKAKELGIYLILKGAHTAIACPDGTCYFNSTGNPGMATGGSGDVLTGIITGLLAQGYTPFEAAIAGVYIHGLAGDFTANELSQEAMLASDIISNIGSAFKKLT